MRVIHLGKFYPPDKGGIETATKSIIDYLWQKNISCDLVCFSSHPSSEEKTKGGTLYRFKSKFKLLSTPFSMEYLFFLIRHIHRYQVVHIHVPNPLSLFFLFCIRPHQKLIVHWHSDVVNQRRAHIFYRPFEKMMLLRSNTIIVGTEEYFMHSEPLQAHKDKVKFISYAVDDPEIAKKKSVDGFIHVLSVGRLVRYKGYENLVRAGEYLNANIKITLIGDGPEFKNLKSIIRQKNLGNIEIRNCVEDLKKFHLEADMFCLPSVSRAESFGISLIEAMSFRLPLITTNVQGSGMNYINIDKKTGIVVELNSPVALANAINELAASEQLREDYSQNSYARFKKLFEYKNVLPEYIRIYSL